MRRIVIGSWLVMLSLGLAAQRDLRVQVVDPAAQPLPFVNIIINGDSLRGAVTDIDGYFRLPAEPPPRRLTMSYIGYRTLDIDLDTIDITTTQRIILQPKAYDFAAVRVIAGENPADVIMRKVIEHRRMNDPEELDSYRCHTYNKVVISLLPQREAYQKRQERKDRHDKDTAEVRDRLKEMMDSADDHHLFMLESVTERRYRRPATYAETILANKVAGFDEAGFAALAHDVQPFSFYQKEVIILDKPFLNPVSPGSPSQYFFHLEDTLYRGRDTVYLITFHPRQGKNFNGLRGVLYINTDRYAVQNVLAEPADSGKIHFRIEQQYERAAGRHWFPAQLNFEIGLPKYPHPLMGLQVVGRSYVREVTINPQLADDELLKTDRYVFADSAHAVSDTLWELYRQEPLDTLERRTYAIVDSLGDKHHFDRWLQRFESLARGRWPLGVLDLYLPQTIRFNQYEKFRLGLALYTNERVASWFTLGGYAGYGFGDRRWKYGAEVHFFPDWNRDWEWRWYYRQDIAEAGGQVFPLAANIISRRFFAQRMDREERYGTFFRVVPARFTEIALEVSRSQLQPLYDYAFRPRPEASALRRFRLSEIGVHLQYAYGQHYRRFLGQRIPDGKAIAYPRLSMSLRRGLGPAFGGDFSYWQLWGALEQSFRLPRLGETSYRLEGAYTRGSVPAGRLFNSVGFGRDFQWLTLGHTFQTMDAYEFLSDRYWSFFFRHDFGKLLFKTDWLQPSISIEHRYTVGNLHRPMQHEGIRFATLQKGYAEAGLIVDNIIRINYLNIGYLGFGVGAFYRYGAYHLPGGFSSNAGYRLSVSIDY